MKDKVTFLRSFLRSIALTVLALIGPVDGVQVAAAQPAKTCRCCGAMATQDPCGPASKAMGNPDLPCHSTPQTATQNEARKTTPEISINLAPALIANSEPSPWPVQVSASVQTITSSAAVLRRWSGHQQTPPNLARLAHLAVFLI